MRKQKWKKVILWAMAAVLCLAGCTPALASAGDRTLLHYSTSDGMMEAYITNVLPAGDSFYVFVSGNESKVLRYTDPAGTPEEFTLPQETYEPYSGAETEEASNRTTQTQGYFAWKDELYVLQYDVVYGDETYEVDGGYVRRLVLADGTASTEECGIPQLDWTNMVEDYGGGYQGSRWMSRIITVGDRLIGQGYDSSGQGVLEMFDLTTGETEEVNVQDISEIFPGPDDTLLYTRTEWTTEGIAHIVRFDPEDQSEEELGQVRIGNGSLGCMCCDTETGTLYYALDGEVWAAPDLDPQGAVQVNDCPMSYGSGSFLLPGGMLLVWSQSVVAIRNTDPSQRGEETLTIQDYAYGENLTDTVHDFNNVRGDVSVILRQGGDSSQVLQAMMNRDAQVDIYTLPYHSSQFDALRNRGFLGDLSGNANIAEAVTQMVPFVQAALQKDGKVIGVPVSLYGSFMGYNQRVAEQYGFTEEELPRTWDQFFDWIETLPGRFEGTDAAAVEVWMNKVSFRSSILTMIINQYQAYLNEGDQEYAFNTPLLRGLLERLDAVNYELLGIMENTGDEEDNLSVEYKEPFLQSYTGITLSNWGGDYVALPLSLTEDTDPILPVTMNVAFVNPFSEKADMAAEYLGLALKNLSTATQYSIFADRNEPLRYPDFEETKENLRKWLEDAKTMLENADEENRDALQEAVDSYEKILSEYDDTYWMIGPKSIEAYRKTQDWIRVLSYDFASSMVSDGKEGDSGYYEMVDAYAQGQITAEELLSGIDKKVQMMRLEGN